MRSVAASVVLATAASVALANPVEKRQEQGGLTDPVILNFALALEHLEAAFYSQGLANYSASDFTNAGFASNVRANIQQIAKDEADHVAFLTSALSAAGATPAPACTYAFPATTVQGFLGLAQVLEGVGVSAYLGAAGSISTPAYLTAAGSILTVEARHSAFIRYANKYSPFPAAFDTPATPGAVVTLAGPFFANCPSGALPAIQGHPAVTVTTQTPTAGQALNLAPAAGAITGQQNYFCAFASGLTPSFAPYNNGQCTIPGNITAGQVYVSITNAQNLTDGTVVAGPAAINIDQANNTASGSSGGSTSSGSGGNSSGSSSGSSGAAVAINARSAFAVIATGLVAGIFALCL